MDKKIPEPEEIKNNELDIDQFLSELRESGLVDDVQGKEKKETVEDATEIIVEEPETKAAEENSGAVEPSAETEEEQLPRVSHDHRFDEEDDDDGELAFELERKRAARKRLKIGIIITSVIIVLLAAASVAMHFVFTPEKTVDAFISAMETGDYAKLSQVAEIKGRETKLTMRNTAPMFELYEESESFRESVYNSLQEDIAATNRGEAPKGDNVVNIEVANFVLFKLYSVSIAGSDAVVYTNFNGAKVSINDDTQIAYTAKGYDYNSYGYTVPSDYFDFVDSKAVFEDILPGNYDVHVEYLSSFGEIFTADDTFAFENEDVEFRLDIEFESVEIENSTDYEVSVMMGETEVQKLGAGAVYKMFPVTAGSVVTVYCDTGDGATAEKSITAGEEEKVSLAFSALTVDNSDNGASVDVYVNGKRIEPVKGYSEPVKIYPLGVGDKVEFLPTETKYQALVMPIAVEITEAEQDVFLIFELKNEIYEGVDEIVKNDIVKSFGLINEKHTKEDLTELVLEYRTLAEMIDYAYNEETQMYSQLTEPEITIDLASDTRAYFVHDAINMYVEATVKFQAGYHEENKTPTEFIEKEIVLSYTLTYEDGAWSFSEITGEH